MPKLHITHQTIRREDGTTLRYFDTEPGSSGNGRPCLVLANGLGGPLTAWSHQIEHFRDRFRVLSWDYRGLYGSAFPRGRVPDLSIRAHVADLKAVLAAAGVDRAVFFGWSMGVQVILELCDECPERVSHLVLINGTFGRPLDGVGVPFLGASSRARFITRSGSMSLVAQFYRGRAAGKRRAPGSSVSGSSPTASTPSSSRRWRSTSVAWIWRPT